MSKAYVLVDYAENPYIFAIKGIVTNKDVAIKYRDMKDDDPDFKHDYAAYEIDDPELLNRIANEGNPSETKNEDPIRDEKGCKGYPFNSDY